MDKEKDKLERLNIEGNQPSSSNLDPTQPPEGLKKTFSVESKPISKEKREEILKKVKESVTKEQPNPEQQKSIMEKLSEVETMIRRAEEIKRDSLKLKIFDNILNVLEQINKKLDTFIEANEIARKTQEKRNDYY
jgi:hypothetical protein